MKVEKISGIIEIHNMVPCITAYPSNNRAVKLQIHFLCSTAKLSIIMRGADDILEGLQLFLSELAPV